MAMAAELLREGEFFVKMGAGAFWGCLFSFVYYTLL